MRKTYRHKSIKDYWVQRWGAVDADAPMSNVNKYPLSCSLDAMRHGCLEKDRVRILEAGCGNGRLLRYFGEDGYDITGVDFAENAIQKILNLNLGIKAEVGDVTNLDFEDGRFTHVLAFGLYHNFEEEMMLSALVETHRVLKRDGILCASFRADNLQNYLNDTFFSDRLKTIRKPEADPSLPRIFHKINLTKKEVLRFVERAGFELLKIYEIDNMPGLYKFKIFRHSRHTIFDENLGRKEGYLLNPFGNLLQRFLSRYFKSQFCNLYVALCEKK